MDDTLKNKLARFGALSLILMDMRRTVVDAYVEFTTDERTTIAAEDFGMESALDVLAHMEPGDHGYMDAAAHALMPGLDGLVTQTDFHVPGAAIGHSPGGITFIELGANNVASSNVSSVACEVARIEGVLHECIYVRYKGGVLYRFWPFKDGHSRWADIVQILHAMKQALPNPFGLTVGEYIERHVKAAFEQGTVACEKLEEGQWTPAKTKAELQAARAAAKAKAEKSEGGPGGGYPTL